MAILIADDRHYAMIGLKLVLEADGLAVDLCPTPQDCETSTLEQPPPLLILGFLSHDDGVEGLRLLQTLSQRTPALPIILLAALADPHLEVGARYLGARGFLSLEADPTEVRDVTRAILGGGTWFQALPPVGTLLTPRQLEVIQALARFDSHKVGAAALQISLSTFERHLAELRARLGVATNTRLVAAAARRRLLALPPESLQIEGRTDGMGSGAAGQRGSGAAGPNMTNSPLAYNPGLAFFEATPTPLQGTPTDQSPASAHSDRAATPACRRSRGGGWHPASIPQPHGRPGLRSSTRARQRAGRGVAS